MDWTEETSSKYAAINGTSGILPWGPRTLIELTGSDRARFLHNLCTAEIKGLAEGKGTEAFVCNVQGKILGHAFIFCDKDSLWIDTVDKQADSLLPHLDKYLITEDVTITDRTADFSHWLLTGPDAAKVLGDYFIDPFETSLSGYLDHCVTADGCAIRAVGGDQPSFVLQCPNEQSDALVAKCVEAGAVQGDSLLSQTFRMEARMPMYGVDLDDRRLPQEADRDELAISFNKGCYLGQETVARIDALGRVNWKLVTLKVGDGSLTPQDLPDRETKLNTGDEESSVGHLTSAVWSPKHNAPMAFALVRRESLENSADELKVGPHAVSVIA